MSKYNIIWLDDEPIKALPVIQAENPEFCFEMVEFIDRCSALIERQPEKYHAVILDANGKKSSAPDIAANKSGFQTLVKLVISKRIPVYIYSGQLERATEGDQAELTMEALNNLGLFEGKNIFSKVNGPYDLVNKIKEDLDSKYQYYVGFEYMLDFFANGWIAKEYKDEYLDPLMEYYKTGNCDFGHGNYMRNVTEQMLVCVKKAYDLLPEVKSLDAGCYLRVVKAIQDNITGAEFIIGPLYHMINKNNAGSHGTLAEEERELFFKSDFATFFLVTYWFNKTMKNVGKIENSMETETNPAPQPRKEKSTVLVETFKEGNKTFFNLKIEVPWYLKDKQQVEIERILPNTDSTKDTVWHVKYRQ